MDAEFLKRVNITISGEELRGVLEEWSLSVITGFREALKEIQEEQEEKFLTADETAKMLGVDKSTLWRWNKSGLLKSHKMGTKVRYILSEVNKFRKS